MSLNQPANSERGSDLPEPEASAHLQGHPSLSNSPRPNRQHHIVLLIVTADLIAGTAYIIGFLLEQHFMLILGVAHVTLGALHYVEHLAEVSDRDTRSDDGTDQPGMELSSGPAPDGRPQPADGEPEPRPRQSHSQKLRRKPRLRRRRPVDKQSTLVANDIRSGPHASL